MVDQRSGIIQYVYVWKRKKQQSQRLGLERLAGRNGSESLNRAVAPDPMGGEVFRYKTLCGGEWCIQSAPLGEVMVSSAAVAGDRSGGVGVAQAGISIYFKRNTKCLRQGDRAREGGACVSKGVRARLGEAGTKLWAQARRERMQGSRAAQDVDEKGGHTKRRWSTKSLCAR